MFAIHSVSILASQIGVSEFELCRVAFRCDMSYRRFTIPKRGGGHRSIYAPQRQLKDIQRWLAKNLLAGYPVHEAATAYRRGSSILQNARPHAGKDFVFNADIKDFFGSINSERVHNLFRLLGYCQAVSFVLTRLCTHNGCLPQGAPSSPAIANLVCLQLDERIARMCADRGWSYTRYCDDITVSGSGSFGDGEHRLADIIESEGFKLNPRKVRLATRAGKQLVTGLVVNESPNLPRQKRRRLRAMFHQASMNPERFIHLREKLQGQAALLQMIRPDCGEVERYREVLASIAQAEI